MAEARRAGIVAEPPIVAAPSPFIERRASYRRAADRDAYEETLLLARSLDILASGGDAEARLAGMLGLLAGTVGARRAAVLADGPERRVAVACGSDEDPAAAEELASWLDAWAPRPRAQRAASARASVAIVVARTAGPAGPGNDGDDAPVDRRRTGASSKSLASETVARHFACLPIPTAGDVVLGFDFADEAASIDLAERLPQQLARHAAVALSLVTEQIATERELVALRATDTERSRFVSTVAHELRTPLTGLSGYLELILDGQVQDEADELDFLERSRQIVESMGELVGDLLELSRLESGTLRLELAPFSVTDIGGRVVSGLSAIALKRGVELRTSLPPRLRSARGDRRRVEQVLTNLVGNALKFTPAGSAVELAGWFEGSIALYAVRDDGGGIEADGRARIFERFHRLAGHEKITGTGLGLPIARDLTRAMGGDLDVASVPGSGSSFVIVLPGPAGASNESLGEALRAAINDEEVRLEERAVLRAIDAARAPAPPARRAAALLSGIDGGRERGDGVEDDSPADRRRRLRAIDGLAGRAGHPRPA